MSIGRNIKYNQQHPDFDYFIKSGIGGRKEEVLFIHI